MSRAFFRAVVEAAAAALWRRRVDRRGRGHVRVDGLLRRRRPHDHRRRRLLVDGDRRVPEGQTPGRSQNAVLFGVY